jgi:hypothetical protein
MKEWEIIDQLEQITEVQAKVIRLLAKRLAELGDVETGKDEVMEAEKRYTEVIGEDA